MKKENKLKLKIISAYFLSLPLEILLKILEILVSIFERTYFKLDDLEEKMYNIIIESNKELKKED